MDCDQTSEVTDNKSEVNSGVEVKTEPPDEIKVGGRFFVVLATSCGSPRVVNSVVYVSVVSSKYVQ
jgi:hypothetical protein